jgi:peptide/nickel transport system permease protein
VRQDPLVQDVSRRLEAPGHDHILGTDRLGRDLASRVVYGARGSLTTASAVVVIGVTIGTALGLVSGYFGRKVDFVIQRGVDVILAFPSMLLAIGIMAFMGQGLVNLILAISLVNIPQVTRLVRSRVLQVREVEFVEAAAIGAGDGYLIRRHVFPSTVGPLVVQATFILVYAIRTEASLSFIGLGIPPPDPSWGGLLDDGKAYIQTAPWMIMAPGGAIALTILGLTLVFGRVFCSTRGSDLMGKSDQGAANGPHDCRKDPQPVCRPDQRQPGKSRLGRRTRRTPTPIISERSTRWG